MNDLLNLIDDMISSKNIGGFRGHPYGRWKYCVALSKCGWEAYSFETTKGDDNDNMVIFWRKEGEDDIRLPLSFTDQRLWIEYMQNKE